MPIRSPLKNFSLEKLLKIKSENYGDIDRGIDYAPSEVDQLIYEKQQRDDVIRFKRWLPFTEHDEYKLCSLCKQLKKREEFHKDKSKKLTGLRSHCKKCRMPIPF